MVMRLRFEVLILARRVMILICFTRSLETSSHHQTGDYSAHYASLKGLNTVARLKKTEKLYRQR